MPTIQEVSPGLLVCACFVAILALIYAYWRTGITQAIAGAFYSFLGLRPVHVPMFFLVGAFAFGFGLREAINHTGQRPYLRSVSVDDMKSLLTAANKASADSGKAKSFVDDYIQQVNKENEDALSLWERTPEREKPAVSLSVSFGLIFAGIASMLTVFYLVFRP